MAKGIAECLLGDYHDFSDCSKPDKNFNLEPQQETVDLKQINKAFYCKNVQMSMDKCQGNNVCAKTLTGENC